MVLGYCFQELSDEILCSDYAWLIPIVVRTTKIKRMKGHWSAMLRQYLRVQMLGAHGLATTGVVLMINGAPLHLRAKITDILSDYDGLRQALDWRGANALRCCLRCLNVYKKGSNLADRLGGVEITEADHRRFEARSNDELYQDVDVVNAIGEQVALGTLRRVRLEEVEKATGQNYNPLGFISDVELRAHCPALDVLTQDWVHGMLSDGVMSTDMWRSTQSMRCGRSSRSSRAGSTMQR